jgi:hypothetical protein
VVVLASSASWFAAARLDLDLPSSNRYSPRMPHINHLNTSAASFARFGDAECQTGPHLTMAPPNFD